MDNEAKANILQYIDGIPIQLKEPRYSILDRWIEEDGLKDYASKIGIGIIAFSPLAQGILTSRYLKGIPKDSRAGRGVSPFLTKSKITDEQLKMIESLNRIAVNRGQSLAQMALSWVLREEGVSSVLVGVSKVSQLEDNVRCIDNTAFTDEELKAIDSVISRN